VSRISDENLGFILSVLALRMAFAGPVFAGILIFNLARPWT